MYTPKPNLAYEQPDHSLLNRLEQIYLASDPFDGEDSDDATTDRSSSSILTSDHSSEGSISSDRDECVSIENYPFTQQEYVSDEDLLTLKGIPCDVVFFDNEAEEWKQVLSYYFSSTESAEDTNIAQ